MPAAGRGRAQRPEFLLRDPRRQDLPGRVVVDAAVPHPRQRRRGEPLPPAQQQPAVRPRRVDLAAAAAEQVLGDPLAHRGHRLIRKQDQVEVVHCDDCVGQGGAHGGGVASVRVDHHHLDGGSELGAARGEPGLDRGAGPPVDLPQQGLLTREVDEPGLPRIRAPPPHPAVVVLPVGQPPRPAEPGLVHPHHPSRLRLDQLDRAPCHHRALHRRPRHPMRGSDLGLVPAVLHRHRQRHPQPGRRAYPGRHLGDLLGKRLPRARPDPTAPAPLAPLHHRELTAARQVARPGQHPALARGRHHRARRAPRRVRIIGHQLHDLHTDAGTHDTLHRQSLESQQTRRIIATVNHGPRLSSRCSKTQRGSPSCGPPSFRRAGRVQPQVARSRSKSPLCRRYPARVRRTQGRGRGDQTAPDGVPA
jgi:hypothetical protein